LIPTKGFKLRIEATGDLNSGNFASSFTIKLNKMKKLSLALLALTVFAASCRTLHSNTAIKPNDSFVLGNNEHGSFKVKLTNTSKNDLEVYMAPVAGGSHSRKTVKQNESISVKVEKNTALIVDNKSTDTASVNLKVKGDLGLSMGYKN
jgi:hypothetical protein